MQSCSLTFTHRPVNVAGLACQGGLGAPPATWDLDTKEAQGEKFINELGFVVVPPRMFRSNFRKKVFLKKEKKNKDGKSA